MTTLHARDQISSRLSDAGLSAQQISMVRGFFERLAIATTQPTAAYTMQLPGMVGRAWGDRSNGDVLVAVVRGGSLVTVFLRRSCQPMTSDALRVGTVLRLQARTAAVLLGGAAAVA